MAEQSFPVKRQRPVPSPDQPELQVFLDQLISLKSTISHNNPNSICSKLMDIRRNFFRWIWNENEHQQFSNILDDVNKIIDTVYPKRHPSWKIIP